MKNKYKLKSRHVPVKVLDKIIKYTEWYKIDMNTLEEAYDRDLDKLNDLNLYAEYRKVANLLQPDVLRYLRNKLNLNQLEMADKIGVTEKEIRQMENGSIQTKELDNKLRDFIRTVEL